MYDGVMNKMSTAQDDLIRQINNFIPLEMIVNKTIPKSLTDQPKIKDE